MNCLICDEHENENYFSFFKKEINNTQRIGLGRFVVNLQTEKIICNECFESYGGNSLIKCYSVLDCCFCKNKIEKTIVQYYVMKDIFHTNRKKFEIEIFSHVDCLETNLNFSELVQEHLFRKVEKSLKDMALFGPLFSPTVMPPQNNYTGISYYYQLQTPADFIPLTFSFPTIDKLEEEKK